MPQSNTVGSSLTPSGVLAKPKNPKSATITEADNGFVISMQKVEEYGSHFAVAKSLEEIPDIIGSYFKK